MVFAALRETVLADRAVAARDVVAARDTVDVASRRTSRVSVRAVETVAPARGFGAWAASAAFMPTTADATSKNL